MTELIGFISERNDDDRFFGELHAKFMSELNTERARGLSRENNSYLDSLEDTRLEDLTAYLREKTLVNYLCFVENFENDVSEALEDL